jgi:hypothetical protein
VIDSQIIFAIIAVNASLFGALLRSPIDILSRPTALSPPAMAKPAPAAS